jgi:hypothetical protein
VLLETEMREKGWENICGMIFVCAIKKPIKLWSSKNNKIDTPESGHTEKYIKMNAVK